MGRLNAALQVRLAHDFKDLGLLSRALTHPSADGANYQRFEFLGDRVLGLVIADWLLRDFPQADEGELAIRYNALVRKEACAEVAERIGLGACITMGAGEEKAGGRRKPAILADACEAVIAALYTDGGLQAARRFIETEWAYLVEKSSEIPQDAKTALQEWAQARGQGVPTYTLVGRSGPDHAPEFTVEVSAGKAKPLRAQGNSKRQAEQTAARALLEALGVWPAKD
ncbi:Ribonuclease III [Parvibaculum lavamentivorans DS-1]|uniref:Ribonuclease 3 n=1 Tax=Parvibaculum lavamentivorans (strain DS-1 / DSM 13023 / NCIMB 13966) TaxID=402881 RepID=A7HX48_PARL1|nr:ribonuclease III [Parvibaculum lavamentivorans]ABS64481.1 Ribonuclease III [Parvibaculum lavamentivorans DS-1]